MGTPSDDAAALLSRRKALRAFTLDMSQAIRACPLPETFVDADRVVRAITVADACLEGLPRDDAAAEPDSERLELRAYGDLVMETVISIAKPRTALDGLRAVRYARSADRMLVQFYAPPKARTGRRISPEDYDYGNDDDAEPRELPEWRRIVAKKAHDQVLAAAAERGCWPDGSPFDAADPDYWETTPPDVMEARAAANEAAGKPVPLLDLYRMIQHAYDTLSPQDFADHWPCMKGLVKTFRPGDGPDDTEDIRRYAYRFD